MFFSPELLSKRDSGFGLLWLAATLGSKSSFKKLPKRSIITADISKLCDLISKPSEPLALRLSSNLMVGVARVFKVKHEIFLSDVTVCFASLKKAVEDMHSLSGPIEGLFQMGQPSVRFDAVTLVADPGLEIAMQLDNLTTNWDEYLGFAGRREKSEPSDDEYGKTQKKRPKAVPQPETVRADMYILSEHHEHLLSTSFDLSFNGDHGRAAADPSSSQAGFDSHNDIFLGDGLDLGVDFGEGIGDDLARELGEGWGISLTNHAIDSNMGIEPVMDFVANDNMVWGMDDNAFAVGDFAVGWREHSADQIDIPGKKFHAVQKRNLADSDKENWIPSLPHTPRSILSQRKVGCPLDNQNGDGAQNGSLMQIEEAPLKLQPKKVKRVRLLLDVRTELTDEELKSAREKYVDGQDALRRAMEHKQIEKESGQILEELIWAPPDGLEAPPLVDFWMENLRAQIEARTGVLYLEPQEEHPTKRRKLRHQSERGTGDMNDLNDAEQRIARVYNRNDVGMDFGVDDLQFGEDDPGMHIFGAESHNPEPGQMRHSEEPEQGRRASRPPSEIGNTLGLGSEGSQVQLPGSQRSTVFPWDNAAASSSSAVGAHALGSASDRLSLDRVDVRMRGSSKSRSRRESSMVPSQLGSMCVSPPRLNRRSSALSGDNFEFDLPADEPPSAESQQSDVNLVALERNSYNFLEYSKMLLQTLPVSAPLTFDDVVPKSTSTPHVAAAAFYHCLVLATKDLLRINQHKPYSNISLAIK